MGNDCLSRTRRWLWFRGGCAARSLSGVNHLPSAHSRLASHAESRVGAIDQRRADHHARFLCVEQRSTVDAGPFAHGERVVPSLSDLARVDRVAPTEPGSSRCERLARPYAPQCGDHESTEPGTVYLLELRSWADPHCRVACIPDERRGIRRGLLWLSDRHFCRDHRGLRHGATGGTEVNPRLGRLLNHCPALSRALSIVVGFRRNLRMILGGELDRFLGTLYYGAHNSSQGEINIARPIVGRGLHSSSFFAKG